MYRILIILLLIFCPVMMMGQKMKKVQAEYTYHAPENISLEAARFTALERAKIEAIAKEFGTIVTRSNTTFMDNSGGKSQVDFYSLSGSDVKGEWIETIGEPKYTISYEQNMLVVRVEVEGRIREIVSASIDFKARILRNGTEDKFEQSEFRDGDDLYLSFNSPVDGYLAVYLVDATQTAYCLLPYRNQRDGIYKVEANRRYLFFNAKEAPQQERQYVDEYTMTCSRSPEHNMIYIVFSPHPFAKAADNASADLLPRELSFADFQKWLVKCRKQDKEMSNNMIPITIKK